MLGLVLFHSDFFFLHVALNRSLILIYEEKHTQDAISIPNAEFVKITYRQGNTAAGPSFYCRECLFKTRATSWFENDNLIQCVNNQFGRDMKKNLA